MLTGEIRSQIDRIWDAFWSGGISNPLEVIEQITYLLFISGWTSCTRPKKTRPTRRRSRWSGASSRRGKNAKARPTGSPLVALQTFRRRPRCSRSSSEHVFPFLRTLGGDGSTYAHHMKDARFTIPTPALLAKVVDHDGPGADGGPRHQGRSDEYMLGKIATAGTNGQFRTPRHIIQLMVEMVAPGAQRT